MKPEAKSTTVQTLIFSKDKYKSAADAKSWARKHGYKSDSVDETDDSFRLRQRDPGDFDKGSFRTITFKDGIKAVIGKLKSAKSESKAEAQYADDALYWACASLVNNCTTMLREIDAKEEPDLAALCEEAIVCATCCMSCFNYNDEASLSERIGACNELSACCELIIEALDGKNYDGLLEAVHACFAQCVLTAGTEEQEGDGPAHPESDESETPAVKPAMQPKAPISKASKNKNLPKSWKYDFKVDVRNEADMEHAEMSVRGPIGYSYEDDTGTSSTAFLEAYASVPKDKPLHVHIDSDGGSIQDGLAIYNALKKHGAEVTTFNDAYALSCASLIALAGDTVISPKSSIWMIHTPRAGTYGDADEHQLAIDMLESHQQMMASVYAEEMGITKDEANTIMEATTWYTGEQAVAAGLADRLSEEDDDQETAEEDVEDEAEGSVRSRFHVLAMHHLNPPEHIRQIISSRLKASGHANKPAGPAASISQEQTPMNANDNPKAASATPAAVNPLEARLEQERKSRITSEISRRAQGKLKNDQIDFWTNLALATDTAEAEQGVYAQLDAYPVAAKPGTESVGPDDGKAEASGTRFEWVRESAIGAQPRPSKRLPWMHEVQKVRSRSERLGEMRKDMDGKLQHCMELDARDMKAAKVVAANTYSSTLITDFLVDTSVTILINRWASLSAFSIEFGPDRYKEYSTAQVKFVASAGSTQRGTKSSPITNFESGDGTVVPISVPMTHYVKSFNVSQEDLMSGLRMENLYTRNLGQFADDVTTDALQPIAGAATSTQIAGPLNSAGAVVNYSAGTIHISAGSFGWNAGQTNGQDLANLWSYLKKSPIKNLILDGNLYGRLTNSPGYFQPSFGTDERGGGDRMKTFGWDLIEENTAWPVITDSQSNAIGGFCCAPQAIIGVTGLPQVAPNIPGGVLTETVIQLPGPDISVSLFNWFNLSARKMWNSIEIMGGFSGGDASAGAVIFVGRGSVS